MSRRTARSNTVRLKATANTQSDPSHVLYHQSIVLFELEPGTAYHFRIGFANRAGNQTISEDYSFNTPTEPVQPLTLLQQEGKIDSAGNVDWFTINVSQPVRLDMLVSNIPTGMSMNVTVYVGSQGQKRINDNLSAGSVGIHNMYINPAELGSFFTQVSRYDDAYYSELLCTIKASFTPIL